MHEESYTIADTNGTGSVSGAGERAILVAYEHADTPASAAEPPRVFELPDGATLTVGRSRAATLSIDSARVSRLHARLTRRGSRIEVEDLDSRNGTWVDGERLSAPQSLRPGDEVKVGPMTLTLTVTSRPVRSKRVGTTWVLDERLHAECERGRLYRRSFALVLLHVRASRGLLESMLATWVGQLRAMDTIAEYSPGEFALLMPEHNIETGLASACALLSRSRTQVGGDASVHAAMSVFPDHGVHPEQLLSRARDGLARARQDGQTDIVLPSPDMQSSTPPVVADPQMRSLFRLVDKVAITDITALILGETGVGKEVVAEAIHRRSRRHEGPLVRVNCACLTDSLLMSELFGHERGAFTGADRQRIGYIEAAHGGTLFLDEVGEMSPDLQVKLLRVLEQRTIVRVGGTAELAVDVRIVCATNRELQAEVDAGRFRSDLYYRLSGLVLVVPPLRDRPAELPLLARRFLENSRHCVAGAVPTLSPATLAAMRAYHWPGNVRELRNAMERALVVQEGGVIEPYDLPERVLSPQPWTRIDHRTDQPAAQAASMGMRERVADVERAAVVEALEECTGNQTRAARRLGLSRRALIYRMEKYGIKPPPSRG